jgi:SAM-dependent methyltransferase
LVDFKSVVKRIVPPEIYRPIRLWWRRRQSISWTNLRRLTPISRVYGYDRGRCIDRYYIDSFLEHHSADIRGHVLEILEPLYTVKFGGDRVTVSDVLDVVSGNSQATIIGDLATGQEIPAETFDCMIVTQTFQYIYDVKSAIANCYRALKPGGVLLASFPGICQISRYNMERWGDYWRFTTRSAERLCSEIFLQNNLEIRGYGNVLVAISYLHGMTVEDLSEEELGYHDPDYEIVITIRAVKS